MTEEMFPLLRVQDVTPQMIIDELERELAVRERVYPRWVEQRKLDRVNARTRCVVLRAALKHFRDQHGPAKTQAAAAPGEGADEQVQQSARVR